MELLEIRSAHNLTTSIPERRSLGANVYQLNCRQFGSVYRNWKNNSTAREHPLGVMTLSFERIWITADEIEQVAEAIRTTHTPLALD